MNRRHFLRQGGLLGASLVASASVPRLSGCAAPRPCSTTLNSPPVKGQLTILLPQPEVQYAAIARDTYMFPRSDGIVLGGTHEEGEC